MQNQEKEKTVQELLQEKLDILAKITPESLVRTGDLGKALDFSKGVEDFKRTLNLFSKLKGVNLDSFPDESIQQLLSVADQAIGSFESIRNFQSTLPDAVTVRNNLIQQVKKRYTNYFNQISQVLAYAYAEGTDFENLVKDAKVVVSKAEEEVKKAENASKEIDGILTAAKKAAPIIGLAKYAVIFKDEAEAHKKKSFWWLIATAALAAFTLILGFKSISYYIEIVKDMNPAQSIQIALAKLVILAVLYFGIVWSGRIYKAHQHNFVINQHRHNALATFETFVSATEDKETKNAVLIQTTKAIFSPQSSGFIAHDKEISPSPQASEIFKIFTGEG